MSANTLLPVLTFLERYKIHHILFWAGYHFAWWTLFSGSITEVFQSITEPHGIVKFLGYVTYQALGVYFCLYVLIPKFLQKRKYFIFFLFSLCTILLMATLITFNYFVAASVVNANVYELFYISSPTPFAIFKYNALPSCMASTTLGMSIKLTKNWVASQKQQQILEKEKLETELKFLKSQFNPHFLFNTINSIFVLIHKNPDMASESLAKFSDLMRYQLYECNEPKIPVERELDYLRNFIELGKLRLEDTVKVHIEIDITGYSNKSIAPFILMPFVENAFKHVSQEKEQENWLKINLSFSETEIAFEVVNSIPSINYPKSNDIIENSGIGLKNVKRRLDLVYPNQYELKIEKTDMAYSVLLKLRYPIDKLIPEAIEKPIISLQS
ncbi:sensor histidine kinase [Flavivirga eckloniae]|uniref:Sensor histidine kinase n=1 Tax=Flavivirga eckloniae TaxID=1803846 RepID=A0A2K9PV33_9FLAO|nr:histidine kinase [Flavivirga eckloniae]AUP80936.1 sensor histidine kinase [Flavivirga eckloniae]